MGERKKEAVPVRRGMLLFQFLLSLCRHDSVVDVATDEFDLVFYRFEGSLGFRLGGAQASQDQAGKGEEATQGKQTLLQLYRSEPATKCERTTHKNSE
jgi:hypothetical protein